MFRALADPSRRAILERLTRGEAAVKDLTARFDISQPAVSQHLNTLKEAGLVTGRRAGTADIVASYSGIAAKVTITVQPASSAKASETASHPSQRT